MKVEKEQRKILVAMLERPEEWWYGLDIFEAAGLGGWRLGTGYPGLAALERDGLIESTWEDMSIRPRRRLYRLTGAGRRHARLCLPTPARRRFWKPSFA